MPLIAKRAPQIRVEFVAAQKQSPLGGLPALEALAQQLDLWKKSVAHPGLHPRTATVPNCSSPKCFTCSVRAEPAWPMPTLLKQMVRLPATLVRSARRLVARVEVAATWLAWWRIWEAR